MAACTTNQSPASPLPVPKTPATLTSPARMRKATAVEFQSIAGVSGKEWTDTLVRKRLVELRAITIRLILHISRQYGARYKEEPPTSSLRDRILELTNTDKPRLGATILRCSNSVTLTTTTTMPRTSTPMTASPAFPATRRLPTPLRSKAYMMPQESLHIDICIYLELAKPQYTSCPTRIARNPSDARWIITRSELVCSPGQGSQFSHPRLTLLPWLPGKD